MFLRRVAQTAGAFATVAFCADKITDSGPRFQRQISVPEKQATFRTYAKDVDDRAYQLFRATDWKEYQTAKEAKVSYKNSPDQNGEVYRLDLTVNSPLDKVVSALQDQSYQKDNWDPDVKEYVIEELGEGVVILHTTYQTSGVVAKVVSPRDFCRIELIKRHSDGMVSTAYCHVDHPGCQPLDGFVRGQVFTSGLFCSPSKEDSNKTRITFIYQSDAKVYIPGYLLHVTNCRRGFEMAEHLKKATEINEPDQPK